MNQDVGQVKEKSRIRRFMESPITIFVIGLASLILIAYIILKIATNLTHTS